VTLSVYTTALAEAAAAAAEQPLEKVTLDAKACIGFLESIGLWDEAKSIKTIAKSCEQPGKHVAKGADRRLAALQKFMAQQKKGGDADERRLNRHYMVRALCALHAAAGPEEAREEMRLDTTTADEQALSQLASRSREMVPALESLRKKAVDRDILMSLVKKPERRTQESDGESSANEFGFSSGSEDEAWKHKELPLVLPPGWKVEHLLRGKTKQRVRVFVDPDGETYKTEGAAKAAVAEFRRSENVAKLLRSRFSAKLDVNLPGQEAAAAGTAPAPSSTLAGVRAVTAQPAGATSPSPALLAASAASGTSSPRGWAQEAVTPKKVLQRMPSWADAGTPAASSIAGTPAASSIAPMSEDELDAASSIAPTPQPKRRRRRE